LSREEAEGGEKEEKRMSQSVLRACTMVARGPPKLEREGSEQAGLNTVGGSTPGARRPARSRELACGIFCFLSPQNDIVLGRGFVLFFFLNGAEMEGEGDAAE